jgi:fluoride exporter
MNEPSFLMSSLYVALGGGFGSWLRYAIGRSIGPTAFPFATLTVNLVGSFAMGLVAGWLAQQGPGGESWRLLLAVGLLGGFTTFSAFSLDIATLVQRGALGTAGLYVLASVVGGIAGLFAGLALTKAAT